MRNKLLFPIIALAIIIFSPLFAFQNLGPVDFWWWMSLNLIIMISLGLYIDKSYGKFISNDFSKGILKKIFWGLVSAIILYAVFYLGNFLSRWMFNFAGEGIQNVYDFKGGATPYRIGILMLLIIGPGEELFWRGFLQRNLEIKLGSLQGYLLGVVIYTSVHLFTGNIMLIVAALVAGLFWGWMFMRFKSILLNIVSHIIWDISVFIIFPFN